MKEIEELLRQRMGLDAATVGPTLVHQAIKTRMAETKAANAAEYLRVLRRSREEWDALVASVVVTETWFFRDREPFRALGGMAMREWLPANPTGQLRLLSLPCSTGEEPYSIAMALLDAGFPKERLQIDAIDIRPEALLFAQRAEYGKNSFRGKDLEFRARHFFPAGKNWVLNPAVRERVKFQSGNILDVNCLPHRGVYDFIFCRNLLIYFDETSQKKAMSELNSLLARDGVLFLGSAEVPVAARNGFVPAKLPLSFACRKAPKEPQSGKLHPSLAIIKTFAETPLKRSPIQDNGKLRPDLTRARQLADAGKFVEAAEICEKHLAESGASADAYYLLGLVRDAAGSESQASDCYRKALYLEPDHYETLLQWASLSEKNGDDAHARILNERAERIRSKTSWIEAQQPSE